MFGNFYGTAKQKLGTSDTYATIAKELTGSFAPAYNSLVLKNISNTFRAQIRAFESYTDPQYKNTFTNSLAIGYSTKDGTATDIPSGTTVSFDFVYNCVGK